MMELLMATDLSARSDRALERAVLVAHKHNARLNVIHVIDDELPTGLADRNRNMAKEEIQKHINTLTTTTPINVSVTVVLGRPHIDILEMSEKNDAQMIILVLHREEIHKGMFRGTTADRILRGSGVPVLLVKDRVSEPYKHITIGVDFSVYSRRAIEFAIRLVPDGEFYLVHAYDVPFKGFLYGEDTKRQVSKDQQVQFQKMI